MAADDEKKRKLRQRLPTDLLPAAAAQACPGGVYRCIIVRRRRTWNGNTTPPRPSSSTRQSRDRDAAQQAAVSCTGAGRCSSRSRGRLCCSRTLLLGQSVTRQVERDVVLHRACWQLLTVIPMPGEGLAHRRQPIFDPTAVFSRLQPGLELHSLDSEQATIVELGTFFKLEWRLFAAANPTSSSARVSFAAFDKLIVFVSATSCGLLWGSKHEIAAQLQSSIHASLQLSCCRTVSLALFPSTHPPRTLTSPKTF